MLKFTGIDHEMKSIYFLGLNRENIDLLISDHMIKVNLIDFDGPDTTIVILFGETDQMLFDELKAEGLIPPEIKYQEPVPGMPQKVVMRHGKPVNEG